MKIGFVLIEGYALMSTSAAIEPLRAANLLAERTLYSLEFISVSGTVARSSAGALFETVPMAHAGTDFDLVFVVAGGDPLAFRDTALNAWLHRLDRAGVKLGGISGGAAILANAGLLERRRFTIHWQHYEALQEISSDWLMERRLFVIDRDRYTCAGGVAPLDMMHALITSDHGTEFSRRISDWFIHTRVRVADDPQRADLTEKYGVHHRAVIATIGLMESHLADTLTVDDLANLTGIGPRQLQRIFTAQLGIPLMQFYRNLRLERAEDLIRQSALPIMEIALATGFNNHSHFTRVFHEVRGRTPAAIRQDARTPPADREPASGVRQGSGVR